MANKFIEALPALSMRTLLLAMGDFTNAIDGTEEITDAYFEHKIARAEVEAELTRMIEWLDIHRKGLSAIDQLFAKMPDVLFNDN